MEKPGKQLFIFPDESGDNLGNINQEKKLAGDQLESASCRARRSALERVLVDLKKQIIHTGEKSEEQITPVDILLKGGLLGSKYNFSREESAQEEARWINDYFKGTQDNADVVQVFYDERTRKYRLQRNIDSAQAA